MEKSVHYYFCLSVIESLDHEMARTARGPAHLKNELKALMYSTMNAIPTVDNGMAVRLKVDEYFGEGEAVRLMGMVNVIWAVTHNHMTERATSAPYMHEPWEFDQVLGIETMPGPDSRTRVGYTPRTRKR